MHKVPRCLYMCKAGVCVDLVAMPTSTESLRREGRKEEERPREEQTGSCFKLAGRISVSRAAGGPASGPARSR